MSQSHSNPKSSLHRPTQIALAVGLTTALWHLPSQAENLDWVWQPQTDSPSYCAGGYQPMEYTFLDAGQAIHTDSDSSEYADGITTLTGNVIVQQGNQRLHSETISLDSNTGVISIHEQVEIRRPGILITADNGVFDTEKGQSVLQHAELVRFDAEMRAEAETVSLNDDDTMVMQNGRFSFCPPGDNSWYIDSQRIDILPEKGFGEARNAVLKLGNVPVFYLPWLSFPIDDQRRSGFLYPKLSTNSTSGLYLATPYYFNLAPNYDAVVTPHIREHRGLYLTTEARYLTPAGQHNTNLLWSVDDKQSTNNRWYVDYQFQGEMSDQLAVDIKLARASDINLFSDYDYGADLADNNKVSSHMVFTYASNSQVIDEVIVGINKHQQLTTNTPSYDLLPYISMQGGADLADDSVWEYDFNYTNFHRDNSLLSGMDKINGHRLHLAPSISQQWRNSYSYTQATAELPLSVYSLDDTPSGIDDSQTRGLYQLSVDSGLYFDRALTNGGTQTLEPRLFWTYTPYKDQDSLPIFDTSEVAKPLYQSNRFNGPDRIGDDHRVTLGVSSRVLTPSGQQKARYSIAQMYYLADRKVQLSHNSSTTSETSSPIYGQMDYQINAQLSTSLSVDWEPSSGKAEAVSANLRYQASNNQIVNLNYTETSTDRQSQASLIWPLSSNWTAFAQHKQDLDNNVTLDEIVGVEYANCCWKTRLVNRTWVDSNNSEEHGVFLELELKGLGDKDTRLFGTGDAELNDFMESITGYNERFNQM